MGKNNITLIGMPGAGKSTLGVLLAKATGRAFIDTDLSIQAKEGRLLQTLVDDLGYEGFIALEEETILGLDCDSAVIAPGGSVVYSERAMTHLERLGEILYLDVSLDALSKRLKNIRTRGVVMQASQTLASLYETRKPLYERYACRTIQCDGRDMENILNEIILG